jgi:hypothetical protein
MSFAAFTPFAAFRPFTTPLGGVSELAALIKALFGNDEGGGIYLPGPGQTFTDTAGTTGAVATNTAARTNDRSPNAAHAVQASAGARPALGRTVEGGRRNLLVNTGFVGAVSGTPGTAPTSWTSASAGGTLTAATDTLTFNVASSARHIFNQSVSVAASTTYVFSGTLVAQTGGNVFRQLFHIVNNPAGSTITWRADGVSVDGVTYVPTNGQRLEVILANGATAGSTLMRLGVGCLTNTTGSATFTAPQFELAAVATDYQRVGASALDVTESGKPEIYYLKDDGIDDSLVATFAAALGDECTIVRADQTGVVTQTAQTVGTTYDIMAATDIYGLAIVNRALTAGELADLQAYLEERRP